LRQRGLLSSSLSVQLQDSEDSQDEMTGSDEQKDWANQLILRLSRDAFEETTDDEAED